jgi:hypothetical protein
MCGDIGTPGTNVYRGVLLDASEKFDKVFVIAESRMLHGTTVQALIRIDGVCSERPDVLIHMHNRSYNLDGYRPGYHVMVRSGRRMRSRDEIHRRFSMYRRFHHGVQTPSRNGLHWLTGALEQCTRDRERRSTCDPSSVVLCRTRSPPIYVSSWVLPSRLVLWSHTFVVIKS